MIKAKRYKPKSPEWVMAMFFNCWRRRAWKQMLPYTQNSWVAQYGEKASKQIKILLRGMLVDANLVQRNNTTPAMAEYLIKINYKPWGIHSYTKTVTSKVRLIRERKSWNIVPDSVTAK